MSRTTGTITRRRSRAFTLAELLIVTLIIAILAAVALPKYGNATANYRALASAKRIAADLALARQHAKSTSSSQTVQFTETSESYVLVGMDDPDHPDSLYQVDLTASAYPAVLDDVDLQGGDVIIFDQYGRPDVGGTITVLSGDFEYTVTVDANTGKASVS